MWSWRQRNTAEEFRRLKDAAARAVGARQYAQAARLFLRLSQEDPQEPEFRVRLAEMLMKMCRTEESLNYYRQALALYISRPDFKKALALCRIILQARPGDLTVRQLKRELLERTEGKTNTTRQLKQERSEKTERSAKTPPGPRQVPHARPQPVEELTDEASWMAIQVSIDSYATSFATTRHHLLAAPAEELVPCDVLDDDDLEPCEEELLRLDPLDFLDDGPTQPFEF